MSGVDGSMTQKLGATRPYLLRAMHEWMTDNAQTPLILVDARIAGVSVPAEHVQNNQIVLNIAWSATHNLQLGNDCLEFDARFGGAPRRILVPIEAVQAIYARESGQGMSFATEPVAADTKSETEQSENSERSDEPRPERPRPGLRIVK